MCQESWDEYLSSRDTMIPLDTLDALMEPSEAKVEPMAISKPLGEVSGVALDKDGNLLVFHRGDRVWDKDSFTSDFILNSDFSPIKNSTIFKVDRSNGFVISEHGENQFYMPHGMTTDKEGNIYLTDVGLHQVFRLNPNFTVNLVLGEKLVPGKDDFHFCQPTDIAVASNGDFFVSDGYCNSRIMKFDKNGKLLAKFGNPNSGVLSGVGEFQLPHTLALVEDLNLLCVGEKEKGRIQCFSAGLDERRGIPPGTLITKADDLGRISGIREKEHYLIGITGADSGLESQMFGIDINSGKATTFAKGLDGHSLAIDDNGDVYVAKMNPNEVLHLNLS
ncbi:hypothetical protein FO519_005372 [Halicephalobus sp. NKZ332]|nr:hypothetical protein FO519_005372 [Halicephalobus sp. NKZ332]